LGAVEFKGLAPVACRPRAMARNIADRMRAIEVLDDHPADAVGGAVDGGVQVGTDVLDHADRRVEQADLDAAVLVDPAARPFSSPTRTATRWVRSL